MARSIKSINSKTGEITVDDGKAVNGVVPTATECAFYGGILTRNKCKIPTKQQVKRTDVTNNNYAKGFNNKIIGSGNVSIVGNNNRSTNSGQYIRGNFADAIRYKENIFACTDTLGRAQVSTLIFQGRTTDNSATEIFIGGESGKRLIIDEDKECSLFLEIDTISKGLSTGITNRNSAQKDCATFIVNGGTLSQNGSTTNIYGEDARTVTLTATSATPDYIKIQVTGASAQTYDWVCIVRITELKTDVI
jgi:hypothetical protein